MSEKYFLHTNGNEVFVIKESNMPIAPTAQDIIISGSEVLERYYAALRDKSVKAENGFISDENDLYVTIGEKGYKIATWATVGQLYPLPENYEVTFEYDICACSQLTGPAKECLERGKENDRPYKCALRYNVATILPKGLPVESQEINDELWIAFINDLFESKTAGLMWGSEQKRMSSKYTITLKKP